MYRCALISEDTATIDRLRKHFAGNELSLLVLLPDAETIVAHLGVNPVDVVFLDLDPPGLDGFALLDQLSYAIPCLLVASTKDHLWPAFRIGAVDYLIKPLTEAALHTAHQRLHDCLGHSSSSSAGPPGALTVRADRLDHTITLADIHYLESLREYVVIYLRGGKRVITLQSMGRLLRQLPTEHFTRIHRSFAVANHRVTAIGKRHVQLGELALRIGGSYRVAVRQVFGG